ICMGATLPILVDFLYRHDPNIGRTVGTLYFVNTIGSAMASFATVTVIFVFLTLQQTVILAAVCNFLVAYFAYRCGRAVERGAEAGEITNAENAAQASEPAGHELGPAPRLAWVLALAAASGYLALSQEIIWMRVLHYVQGDKATTFGHALGFILV